MLHCTGQANTTTNYIKQAKQHHQGKEEIQQVFQSGKL